jgi:hypothetical protein
MESPLDDGRAASAEALAMALATAPLPYLEGALDNPALSPELLLILFKNRAVTAALLQRIALRQAWLKTYEVRAALVLHPRSPRPIAMALVGHLWWKDLARITDHAGLPPFLRRTAERFLSVRLKEMALGEKIALARIAGRGVIGLLRRAEEPMVIRALLQNPRLLEEDALAIAGSSSSTGPVLRALAEDGRFALRPAIVKAIVQNRETPSSVALRIVNGMSTHALKELAKASQVTQLVRVAALRLIESREGTREGSV